MATAEGRKRSNANLMPPEEVNSRLTPEEMKKKMSMMGKASAEKKKQTKTLKELLIKVLDDPNMDEAVGKKFEQMGFPNDSNVHLVKMVMAIIAKAEKGDLKALEMLMQYVYGEKQELNLNLEGGQVLYYLPEKDEE